MCLHGSVTCLEARICAEELGGIRLRTTRATIVVERRRLERDRFSGGQPDPAFRERMRDRLVLADRAIKDDARVRVVDGKVQRGTANTDGLHADHDAFWVQAVEKIVKPAADF